MSTRSSSGVRLVLPAAPAGVSVATAPDRPLPSDREAWWSQVAGEDAVVERAETHSGWPVALVRRGPDLFAFYELFDRGVVVSVTLDGAGDDASVREWLLGGDIDRQQRDIVAISQLWEGL